MKKLLVLFMLLSLVFVFAACDDSNDPATGGDPALEDVEKADDPEPSVVEAVVGDPAELESELGIAIDLGGEYQISRYAIIDENIAQIEFLVGESNALARVAAGQYENMSEMTSEFAFDETVEIEGLSVRVRYADPEETAAYSSSKLGVADAYDAANDISYMVTIFSDATKADLSAIMEALIAGSTVN